MGFIKKVCGKLGLSDLSENDELLEEEYEEEEARASEPPHDALESKAEPKKSPAPLPSNVVDLQAAVNGGLRQKMKVVVIEPRSFDDVQQVANYLKEKKPVLINFEQTNAEEAHRIIDFISGATYAIAGDIKKVGHNVFLCAPSNVSVSYTQERGSLSGDVSWLKK
ncbi:MAG: cell division protein SepF [Schwartzia sp.]|nr:cell division protein SepF [Schwartzia sp. (in: firmicutes)]MBR1885976.1 cell division protein SepF [Schwartzia sp. (in: firmicutes)]